MLIEFVHAIPGRLRLRIHAVNGDGHLTRRMTDRLSAVAGIRRVDINPRTGSLLLRFDPSATRSAVFVDALTDTLGEFFPEDFGVGRVRILVPILQGHAALAGKISRLLTPIDGIQRFDLDPHTGVLCVAYDTGTVTTPEFATAIATPLARLIPWIDIRALLARAGWGV